MPQLESPHPLVTVAAFLVLIGTLVVFHELGHYLVGRWFGVKADKFSIGFRARSFSVGTGRQARHVVAQLGHCRWAALCNLLVI